MPASRPMAGRSPSSPIGAPLIEEEPDRPTDAKDREDVVQVHLLPLDGGEARRLTDLPRGVSGFEWSPDGARLVVTSTSHEATRELDLRRRGLDAARDPGAPPPSDYRYLDRLDYMLNGAGFVYDRVPHLWLVDVATGEASRLTDGPVGGSRAGLVAGRDPDRVHVEPSSRPRPAPCAEHLRRRRRVAGGPRRRGRSEGVLRVAGLARRRHDRRARRAQPSDARRRPQ